MEFLHRSDANVRAYERLSDALKSPIKPLAFVGAGLSARVGYPTWSQLLQQLMAAARKRNRRFAVDPFKSWRVEDLTWRAQVFRQKMGDDSTYRAFLRRTFAPPPRLEGDRCLPQLVRLGFQHYLTTNYDESIEIALRRARRRKVDWIDWSDTEKLLEWIYSLDDPALAPRVVHVHGRYDRPDGVILSDDDYTDRYIRSEQAARNLHVLFATKRIVFVGFSLADAELMYLLRLAKGSTRVALAPRHFAILTIPPTGPDGARVDPRAVERLERQRLNHLYGVEPIFYKYDEDHTWLEAVLYGLGGGAAPGRRAPGPTIREPGPITDPEDPQKGRWGGRPDANHRRLSAAVSRDEEDRDWFQIVLEVRSTDPGRHKLTGHVRFHLHHTFAQRTRQVPVRNGVARLELYAIGAFTVGAEADGGRTHLELDLAKLAGVPRQFREN